MTRQTENHASGIIGVRVGSPPLSEADHYYLCAACGQAVDMRDLGQVFHHEDVEHEPLPNDDAIREERNV